MTLVRTRSGSGPPGRRCARPVGVGEPLCWRRGERQRMLEPVTLASNALRLTPRPVATSLDELLAGVTDRASMLHSDSKSGVGFERVVIDGTPHVLKHVHVDDDWTMRFFAETTCIPLEVWRTGMIDVAARAHRPHDRRCGRRTRARWARSCAADARCRRRAAAARRRPCAARAAPPAPRRHGRVGRSHLGLAGPSRVAPVRQPLAAVRRGGDGRRGGAWVSRRGAPHRGPRMGAVRRGGAEAGSRHRARAPPRSHTARRCAGVDADVVPPRGLEDGQPRHRP